MLRHDAFEEFGTTSPHQPVNAKDFACSHGHGDMVDQKAAPHAGQGDVVSAEDFLAELLHLCLGEVF